MMLSEEEMVEAMVKVAEYKNPFAYDDICDYFKAPKYNRVKFMKENNGLTPYMVGRLTSTSSKFEKIGMRDHKTLWKHIDLEDKGLNENRLSDAELLDLLREVSKVNNPFSYTDVCRYKGWNCYTTNRERIDEKYGVNSSRIAYLVQKRTKDFKRDEDFSEHHARWICLAEPLTI